MIAVKELAYSRVTYMPGEEFECSDQDANTLKIIGMASDVEDSAKGKQAAKSVKGYKRRDMTAEPSDD